MIPIRVEGFFHQI